MQAPPRVLLIDVGRKLHPENTLLPYVTGVALYQSGAAVRWLDTKCRGKDVNGFLLAPGSGVTKGVLLALLWSLWGHGQKRDRNMVRICGLYTFLDLLTDISGFDAFAGLHKPLVPLLQVLRRILCLG